MWWLLTAALAVEGGPELEGPRWVRVDDPAWPGALTRSATGAVLAEPPPAGTRWRWEPDVRTDGWPSQTALGALNADVWHDAGIYGAGVKVAVFDIAWFGAEADPAVLGDIQTNDCYAHPSCAPPIDTLHARFAFEEGEHGFACAEIVHEIAPEAELHLVRVNGFTAFENAADWAIAEGVDVISMSLSFFNSSFYDGTGPFGPVVKRLRANGVQLVTSAGNSARQHWMGPYLDADQDGRLDFDGSNSLQVELNAGGRRTIYVNWDEHERCGGSDLDVLVFSPDGYIVGRGVSTQSAEADQCEPVERISVQADVDGVYTLEVYGRRLVSAGLEVDVITQSGALLSPMPAGSIVDPGVHPGAFTVGAVRGVGYLDNPVESFSSQGPVRSGALKPDIAGPDGLDAEVFGAVGFFGTSASTPAVAGALALVLSRELELSAPEGADRLRAWAWRRSTVLSGHDPEVGAGLARLPELSDGPHGCGRGTLWAALLVLPWGRRRAR